MSGCRTQLLSDVSGEWRVAEQQGFDTLCISAVLTKCRIVHNNALFAFDPTESLKWERKVNYELMLIFYDTIKTE